MKELEFVVVEKYSVERRMALHLSDKQYSDWINGNSAIESTLKWSRNVKDFLMRSKEIRKNKKDCGFIKALLSNYNNDFKNKECEYFDILYINDKNN